MDNLQAMTFLQWKNTTKVNFQKEGLEQIQGRQGKNLGGAITPGERQFRPGEDRPHVLWLLF